MNVMNTYIKKEVAVIGANTTFSKITAFLLKQSPLLSKLTLYDDKSLKPLEDIKYLNTACQVSFVHGRERMREAIKNADIIIIGDDNPKEMNHEATLMSKAPSFSNYVKQIADHNSEAIIVVATYPINMTVPLAAEVLKNLGKFDERKLIGMTNVENIKARSILARHLQINPGMIDFPVIGGLTSETSVPLLSNMTPRIPMSKANLQKITCAVKTSATKLHYADGSQENLNRAYATAKLVKSIVNGLNGYTTVETVLSYQNIMNPADYFSLPVLLGENGIVKHMTLPNISQREKCLLSHAIACMVADSKKAKNCYDKLPNNIVKTIPASQNKLNKLKPPAIQNKQSKSQFAPIHYGTQNKFQPAMPNETLPSDMKLKSTMDHISSTMYSCNEKIKKSKQKNKLNNFYHNKSQTQSSVESKKENDSPILMKPDSYKVMHQTKEQSGQRKSDAYSIINNKKIDQINKLYQAKSINTKSEIPISQAVNCIDGSNTQSSNLESDESISQISKNKNGNSPIHPSLASVCIRNHADVKRSVALDSKKFSSESEKPIDEENAVFKLETQILNIPENMKDLNSEEKIISIDPNFMNTKSVSPQLVNEVKKCIVGEDKWPLKHKKYTTSATSENIATFSQQKRLISENLDKIFTSNIIRIINEKQSRKRRLDCTPEATRNQSEQVFDERTKVINFDSKGSIEKDHFDSTGIRSTKKDDDNMSINKTDRESLCDPSIIVSNVTKANGNKYSLHTNKPHWILYNMLFKSKKYQSSKPPMLSRYVSSESHDSEIKKKLITDINSEKARKQVASPPKPHTNINKSLESLCSRCISSEVQNQEIEIKNKTILSSNTKNKKKQVNSLPKFQTNIKSPRDTFLARYASSESNDKIIENKKVMGSYSGEKVNYLSKSQRNINRPHESVSGTSEPDNYDSQIPVPKLRTPKHYGVKRNISLNPKESSDSYVFENLFQKQKNSISSGHKIASFKIEGQDESFLVLQRKKTDFEMLEKAVHHRNNPNGLQKLHLLTSKSKECVTKVEPHEKKIKSSRVPGSNWENSCFKQNEENSMTKISKQKISEANEQNIDNVRNQFTKWEEKNNLGLQEGEHEKNECKEIIDNNQKNVVDTDTHNISNNQVISIPYSIKKTNSDKINFKTNSVNNEGDRSEENSLEPTSSKENENDTA